MSPETTMRRAKFALAFRNRAQVLTMILIRELVQQALATNYLTVEAEEQLRRLLKTKYELEDLKAFVKLQQAVMEGRVRQESRYASS